MLEGQAEVAQQEEPDLNERRRELSSEDRQAVQRFNRQRSEEETGVMWEDPATLRLQRGTPAAEGDPRQARSTDRADVDFREQSVTLQRTRRSTQADGLGIETPRENQRSVGVNADGEVTASFESLRGENEDRRGVGGTLGADLGNTGLEGGSVSINRRRGNNRFSTNFGYDVDIEEPEVRSDNRWQVQGTLTWTGRFGGSSSRQGNTSREGSVTATIGEQRRFTRTFSDEQAARQWYDRATSHFGVHQWAEFGQIESATEAAQMGHGDSRAVREDFGLEGSGSITFGPSQIRVGMSVGINRQVEVTVTRADRNSVDVRFQNRTGGSVGGDMSVPLAGMSFGGGGGVLSGTVVRFDISGGEGTPGWVALDRLLHQQQPPTSNSGRGWQVIERSRGTQSTDRHGANILGLQMSDTSTLEDEEVVRADGTRARRITGENAQNVDSILPDYMDEALGTNASTSTRIQSETGAGATLRFQVDGSDARDTHQALGRATGAPTHLIGVDGEDGGEWTVTTQLSESQLQQVVATLESGNYDRSVMGTAADEALALTERLRRAGSFDDKRAAIADFVSEMGDRGVALIRRVLRARLDYDVSQENSTVFQGEEGRNRLAQQIDALQRRVEQGENPTQLLRDAQVLQQEQRQRINAMQSENELPPDLRASQVDANRQLMQRLDSLVNTIRRSIRQGHQNEAQRQARDEDQNLEARAAQQLADEEGVAPQSSEESHARAEEMSRQRDVETSQLRGALRNDETRMTQRRREALDERASVRREWHRHYQTADQGSGVIVHERLTGIFDGENNRLYAEANQHTQAGNREMDSASELYSYWERMQDQLPENVPLNDTTSALVQDLRRTCWALHDHYLRARESYVAAKARYQSIRNHNPDRRYWGNSRID
jgi:hypothetical protein